LELELDDILINNWHIIAISSN